VLGSLAEPRETDFGEEALTGDRRSLGRQSRVPGMPAPRPADIRPLHAPDPRPSPPEVPEDEEQSGALRSKGLRVI